jgi:hypothetical protein
MVRCDSNEKSSSDYMMLESVQYVKEFPQTFFLNSAVEIKLDSLDILGIQDFCIVDTMLIFTTKDKNGLWSFVSLPNYHSLGRFLKSGNGPQEFIQIPWVYSQSFFKEKGSLFAAIYDFPRGRLYKMNIYESIKNNQLNIFTLKGSLPRFLFNFLMIDSTTFMCREINDAQTKETRYILNRGKKIIPPVLEKLNLASVRKGEDFNILATITKKNDEKKLIVEMPIGLNYINIYSLDGSFGKTICIGNKLNSIEEIQNKSVGGRVITFNSLALFSKFWGVTFINEDKQTYLTKREKYPSILLFDWTGHPLAELKLDTFITSFDIDLKNGNLFTFDLYTEKFCKYDIRNILAKL